MSESGLNAHPPQNILTPENSENAADQSQETVPQQVCETSENHESAIVTPEKRKRGRPRKNPIEVRNCKFDVNVVNSVNEMTTLCDISGCTFSNFIMIKKNVWSWWSAH